MQTVAINQDGVIVVKTRTWQYNVRVFHFKQEKLPSDNIAWRLVFPVVGATEANKDNAIKWWGREMIRKEC